MVACSGASPARGITPAFDGRTVEAPLSALARTVNYGWNSAIRTLFPALSAQQFPGPPPTPAPPARRPVRVGGNIQVPRKLVDVKPACPATANAAVATSVVLFGRVDVDGTVGAVTVLPANTASDPLPEFVQSAVDAVRQWVFTPTLLNGQPVPVNVTVRISYNVR